MEGSIAVVCYCVVKEATMLLWSHHLALLGAISNTCIRKLANLPALMEHRLVVMQDTCAGYDANRVDTARWCPTSFDCLVDAQHSVSVPLQWEKESIVD